MESVSSTVYLMPSLSSSLKTRLLLVLPRLPTWNFCDAPASSASRVESIRYIQRVTQYVDLVESNRLCTDRPRSTMSVVAISDAALVHTPIVNRARWSDCSGDGAYQLANQHCSWPTKSVRLA